MDFTLAFGNVIKKTKPAPKMATIKSKLEQSSQWPPFQKPLNASLHVDGELFTPASPIVEFGQALLAGCTCATVAFKIYHRLKCLKDLHRKCSNEAFLFFFQ